MEALLALINQKIADFSATAFKNGEIIDINNEDIKFMFDKIDKNRFFKPDTSHLDYTVANKQECKPGDPHPNTEGHKDWARQIKEFIDANDLRTIQ